MLNWVCFEGLCFVGVFMSSGLVGQSDIGEVVVSKGSRFGG